jgi:hypothetical protein
MSSAAFAVCSGRRESLKLRIACQVAAEACCNSIQRSKALTEAEMNGGATGLDIARLIAEALTDRGFNAFRCRRIWGHRF